ncbi:MAG: hypothetical protein R3B09_10795 [Nannocystaceae bacterium]
MTATPLASNHPRGPEGPVRGVVHTGPVFAAILEQLNRDAALAAVERLGAHCEALVEAGVREALAAQRRSLRRIHAIVGLLLIAFVIQAAILARGERERESEGRAEGQGAGALRRP